MATARYQQQVAALFEFLKTVATEVGSSVGVGLIEKVPANSRFLHFFGLSVPSVAASDDEQADIFFYDPKGHGGVGAKYVVNGSAFAVNRTDQNRAVQALLDTWHQLQANELPAYFRSAEGHNVAMTNAHLAPPESVQTLLTERRRVHEVSSWRFRRLLLTGTKFAAAQSADVSFVLLWHGPASVCPKCQQLLRAFQACAQEVQRQLDSDARSQRPMPLFLSIDAIANEMPGVRLRRLPTLQYWPAAHHSLPVSTNSAHSEFFLAVAEQSREYLGNSLDSGANICLSMAQLLCACASLSIPMCRNLRRIHKVFWANQVSWCELLSVHWMSGH